MGEDKKAKKAVELGSNNSFFSSLGFDTKKEEAKKEPSVKKEESKSEIKKEDLLNASLSSSKFGNAKVVRTAPARPARPSRPARPARPAAPNNRRRPGSAPARRGDAPRNRGNISFGKGKRPPVKKAAPTPKRSTPKKSASVSTNLIKKETVTIGGMITVKEFSEKMGIPLGEIMKVMMQNKILGGLNTALDFDTAAILGEELGVNIQKEQDTISVENILEGDLKTILDLDKESEDLITRAPIVTIMGHVDHGKTTLLDYLRKTDFAGAEAGGITQSIGASMIKHDGKFMTVIDTPGHQLFTTMRARGAKLTDIAIIVIAADDGFKPQTIESVNHAKEAGVPIIIAITKIDKPGNNNVEQIKSDLGKYELIPEDRGGDVPVIGVSGLTGQGVDELLEQVALQAEMLELKYNPKRKAVGVVLDAKKSARQGIETSIIVMTGTLKVGDVLAVHNTYGKVKRMIDRTGKAVKQVSGGEPVQILGISDVPKPGRIAEGVKNEKEAAQKIAIIQENEAEKAKTIGLSALMNKITTGEKTVVKLILKADGPTALEALEHAIDGIECPENVEIKKVHMDIGQFTDSDVALAEASEALMIGFNIKTASSIKKKAEQLKLTCNTYEIIYELTEYLEDLVMGLIEVEMEEVVIGKLNILGVFFRKGKEMVVGGKVLEGKVKNGCQFKIIRNEEEFGKGTITSLQRDQNSVKEISEGYECGMKVKVSKKIEEGDILEFREMQEKK